MDSFPSETAVEETMVRKWRKQTSLDRSVLNLVSDCGARVVQEGGCPAQCGKEKIGGDMVGLCPGSTLASALGHPVPSDLSSRCPQQS